MRDATSQNSMLSIERWNSICRLYGSISSCCSVILHIHANKWENNILLFSPKRKTISSESTNVQRLLKGSDKNLTPTLPANICVQITQIESPRTWLSFNLATVSEDFHCFYTTANVFHASLHTSNIFQCLSAINFTEDHSRKFCMPHWASNH